MALIRGPQIDRLTDEQRAEAERLLSKTKLSDVDKGRLRAARRHGSADLARRIQERLAAPEQKGRRR